MRAHCTIGGVSIVLLLALVPFSARATETLCTIAVDARSGTVLLKEGDCDTRVTPASTFKIPLAAMGYEAGILETAETPALPFKQGYADWGGDAWRKTTNPTYWMHNSVVWYSQLISRQLGLERLEGYGRGFGYGNLDFSGDSGKNNGLDRSWISSSLRISPVEQTTFLRRLITGTLPISQDAARKTIAILETNAADGWTISGKTGSAYPRNADGSFNRARMWGWYVGWALKGDSAIVFARLGQETRREQQSAGRRTRTKLLQEWGTLVERAGR